MVFTGCYSRVLLVTLGLFFFSRKYCCFSLSGIFFFTPSVAPQDVPIRCRLATNGVLALLQRA